MRKARWLAAAASLGMLTVGACASADALDTPTNGGNGSVVDGTTPASPPPSAPPTPAATQAAAENCVAGTWTTQAPDPNDPKNSVLPVQFETTHFAIRYKDGTTTAAAAQAAANHLESVWNYYIGTIGFPQPYCMSTAKKRANVFVGIDYGLNGSIDARGNMAMYMGPGGIQDHFGLAHEFAHALQGSTGSLQSSPFTGWIWESHANWMAMQLPEFHSSIVQCSALAVNNPHLYLGSSRMRYCNFQFMEYLKNQYGYGIINDIWRNSPKPGDPAQSTGDPFKTLMANRGWTVAQMNDEFGRYAMHNANWDYTNPDGTDQGAFYRSQYGNNDPDTNDKILRTTTLDPMSLDQRRFAVQSYQAPQRWGYNLVRVYPDAGATSVKVDFRGVTQSTSATSALPGMQDEPSTVPVPNSGWRWGLVAVNKAGASRYSALQNTSSGSVTMPVNADDQAVYMVVMGAPTEFQQIRWDQPFYSLYRYPWMVQFTNAMPAGYQTGAPAPIPGGHQHPNGGGWIAKGVKVPETVYVGPYARVLGGTVSGNARIEDHAVVVSGTVRDNARIGGLTVVRGNTVLRDTARAATSFAPLGFFEQNIVLSGNAQNIGDVEQRGASFSTGVYYGFVDQAAATTPARGSNRTTPVPEVTAAPDYTWY